MLEAGEGCSPSVADASSRRQLVLPSQLQASLSASVNHDNARHPARLPAHLLRRL